MTLTIDNSRNNKISFGENIQTRKVIKLVVNSRLKGEANDMLDVSRAMCKEPCTDVRMQYGLNEVLRQCREKLIAKFPGLEDVEKSYQKKFQNKDRSERYTQRWLNRQVRKMGGEEIDVPSFNLDFFKHQNQSTKDYLSTHAY